MDDRLEEFMRELAAEMSSLPEEERQQRLASASKRLEVLVAANLAGGADEEKALDDAIRRYREEIAAAPPGAARSTSEYLDRLRALPPVAVTALYCTAAYNAARLAAWLFWMFIFRDAAHSATVGTLSHTLLFWWLPPSFLLSAAAATAVVCRDGIAGAVRTVKDGTTTTGLALRWIGVNELLHTVLFTLVLLIARDPGSATVFGSGFSAAEPDPVRVMIILALLALLLTCPFVAGWSVAKRSGAGAEFVAIDAVKIAAMAAFALNLVDLLNFTLGQVGREDFLALMTQLIVVSIVQAMYFSLAIAGAALGTPPRNQP